MGPWYDLFYRMWDKGVVSTPSRIRTRGLLIRSQALYPLSYGGTLSAV